LVDLIFLVVNDIEKTFYILCQRFSKT